MQAEFNIITSVFFQESHDYYPNPFMGPVAPGHMGTRLVEGTLVVGGFNWVEIEAEKGIFDFTKAEEAINYHYWTEAEGSQLILGMSLDYPTLSREIGMEHIDIPLWMYEELKVEAEADYLRRLDAAHEHDDQESIELYNEALYRILNDEQLVAEFNRTFATTADIPGVGTFYRWRMDMPDGGVEYRGGFSPNYASPLLLEYHNRALKAVAERYDNEKTFAILMNSLGHWGEPHTYYIKDPDAAGHYPPKKIASRYEEKYAEYFENVFVSSRVPREVARDNNFGLHNHAFGDPQHTYDWFMDYYKFGYTSYHTGESYPAMPDFWKKAPSGGEFLYTGDQRFLEDENIEATIQMARDTHITWLNEAYFHMTEEAEVNQKLLFSKIGYRFMIESAAYSKQVTAGNPLIFKSNWKNSGTAPFYRDWPIIVRLQNAEGVIVVEKDIYSSVNSLFPNTRETYRLFLGVPPDLQPGMYQLWVGIVNPETGKAEIQLTLKNALTYENMVFVGEVEVSQSNWLSKIRYWLLHFMSDITGIAIGLQLV